MRSEKIVFLSKILHHVKILVLQPGNITTEDLNNGTFRAKLIPDGRVIGIGYEAAKEFSLLCQAILSEPEFRKIVSPKDIEDEVIELILGHYVLDQELICDLSYLQRFEEDLTSWLRSEVAHFDFYIPCSITLEKSPSFQIGRVVIEHVDDFHLTGRGNSTVIRSGFSDQYRW